MPKAVQGENDAVLTAELSVQQLFGVAGKVVLVTGGGSGIGAMIASGFVQNGAVVYIASRKDTSPFASELTAKGPGKCFSLTADVGDEAQVKTLLSEIDKREGKLDVLVNNAGTNFNASIDKHSSADFMKVMQVNVNAVFIISRLAMPLLEKAASEESPARIINISSVNGMQVPGHYGYGYTASKAAVNMLTQHLAANVAERLVTINAVAPGPFPSRMMRGTIDMAGEENVREMTSLKRLGMPGDMAGACLYLASRAGSFVTGTVAVVDGGLLVKPKL